ncbi:MAG: hypothetical protein RLY43_41 [Bacteroidota bacterium]|jgi:hypothetical protein
MIRWSFFPKNIRLPNIGQEVINAFEEVEPDISSIQNNHLIGGGGTDTHSNTVLEKVSKGLIKIGFQVEIGKRRDEKINIPVLFGECGKPLQSFDADAYNPKEKFVIEVEAGRAVTNYQFLKDYFQACVMVDVDYLAIAVRQLYRDKNDYEIVVSFFDTLYASGRLQSKLKGVLIIGY